MCTHIFWNIIQIKFSLKIIKFNTSHKLEGGMISLEPISLATDVLIVGIASYILGIGRFHFPVDLSPQILWQVAVDR